MQVQRVSHLATNREVSEVPIIINAFLMFVESHGTLDSKIIHHMFSTDIEKSSIFPAD